MALNSTRSKVPHVLLCVAYLNTSEFQMSLSFALRPATLVLYAISTRQVDPPPQMNWNCQYRRSKVPHELLSSVPKSQISEVSLYV